LPRTERLGVVSLEPDDLGVERAIGVQRQAPVGGRAPIERELVRQRQELHAG
jgi:hypothetical protein